MATADRQLFDYFYKIRMNGGKRNGNNTLYLDNHTAVTRAFYFQEDAFLTLEVTARDTDFGTFGQIQFILSLIHISEPTRPEPISYAVFCLKRKKWVVSFPCNTRLA